VDDADQVLKTFHAVLAIARLQAAGRPPNVEGFDPSELARGVAELYQPLCEDKGVSFACELGQGLKVRADRDFMAQALANLLDNAVKYTPPGGAVMLRRTRRRPRGSRPGARAVRPLGGEPQPTWSRPWPIPRGRRGGGPPRSGGAI
jgi:signal transduction histidine kinase